MIAQLTGIFDGLRRLAIAAIGSRAMLPVSRSEPARITRIRPRLNTPPNTSVGSVPHSFVSSPDVTAIASSDPKAM